LSIGSIAQNCHGICKTEVRYPRRGPSTMPGSATFVFDDPFPYQAAIRGGEAEALPTAKGNFRVEWTQIDCGRLWLQYASENLPRVIHSNVNPKRLVVVFLANHRQAPAYYSGIEVGSKEIVLGLPGSSRHVRTHQACKWASMSLTEEDFSTATSALLGRELHKEAMKGLVLHPAPAHMARFVRLHTTARQLVEGAPEIFEQPEVSNAIEHELLHALVGCLADTQADTTLGWRRHTAIIKRLEDFAADSDRPLNLTEICAATGTSERLLRICCHEHLGMSPVQYLWLRRMHLVRGALMSADPARTSVTQILTRYGFWQLGRVAVAYRGLFGESPSATLRGRSNPGRAFQKNFHRPLKDSENE
jgi:AraC-like DNA-binding protein